MTIFKTRVPSTLMTIDSKVQKSRSRGWWGLSSMHDHRPLYMIRNNTSSHGLPGGWWDLNDSDAV